MLCVLHRVQLQRLQLDERDERMGSVVDSKRRSEQVGVVAQFYSQVQTVKVNDLIDMP